MLMSCWDVRAVKWRELCGPGSLSYRARSATHTRVAGARVRARMDCLVRGFRRQFRSGPMFFIIEVCALDDLLTRHFTILPQNCQSCDSDVFLSRINTAYHFDIVKQ